jgi:hypothetical protein
MSLNLLNPNKHSQRSNNHPQGEYKGTPLFCPDDLVLIKSPNPTWDLNTPSWEGPHPVILSISIAGQVAGLDSSIHHSRVKGWNPPVTITPLSLDPESEPASLCEPLDGLKLLFKRKTPTDTDEPPS